MASDSTLHGSGDKPVKCTACSPVHGIDASGKYSCSQRRRALSNSTDLSSPVSCNGSTTTGTTHEVVDLLSDDDDDKRLGSTSLEPAQIKPRVVSQASQPRKKHAAIEEVDLTQDGDNGAKSSSTLEASGSQRATTPKHRAPPTFRPARNLTGAFKSLSRKRKSSALPTPDSTPKRPKDGTQMTMSTPLFKFPLSRHRANVSSDQLDFDPAHWNKMYNNMADVEEILTEQHRQNAQLISRLALRISRQDDEIEALKKGRFLKRMRHDVGDQSEKAKLNSVQMKCGTAGNMDLDDDEPEHMRSKRMKHEENQVEIAETRMESPLFCDDGNLDADVCAESDVDFCQGY